MRINKLMTTVLIASSTLWVDAQPQMKSGIDLKNLNQTVNPGENFYEYACGGWMKNNPLPAAYSRYGSFDRLGEDNNKRINTILKDLQKRKFKKGTTEQKLSDFYKLAMDSRRRDKEGVAPVLPILKELENAATKDDLFALQKRFLQYGDQQFLRFGFGADEKDSKNNILSLFQGGITLGQKEYYLDTDSSTTAIREAYKKHIVRMFTMFGFEPSEATQKMERIMRIEIELAKVSRSQTELRDVEKNYNKMSFADFQKNYPHIRLDQQLEALNVNPAHYQTLVVGQPDFLAGVEKLLSGISSSDYRAYMEWGVILGASSYLSNKVSEANFDFFGKTLRGRKEDYPLWKRATEQIENEMGEALGKIYAERYFPASSKERMEQLVKNLQVSLGERIKEQKWMSETTKQAALEKLNTFYVKIGYPDKWKDITGLIIDPKKSYYENVMACNKFWVAKDIEEKAGKPVDKDEWLMYPQTVNAYYNPTTNEICFPAGILQVPFFDPTADDAFNYGAIGVVIGHEMTHGFDDQGRHYDKDGNMTDWWNESDSKNFEALTKKYVEYFSNIKVLPDLNANGLFTLGENLADHGGLEVAFNAYKNATRNAPLPTIDGLTADQRFFLAYSGVWGQNITEKEIRNRTKSDPHSLGKWRVNGALPHINAWYDAFNIKESDKMFIPRSERLDLW
ncbi:MAG: M13 family metallopeptidase [Prevotellaceae bacterium]|nr:M13 family metallopeptidase [Prevotella sp.]MDD7258146.1 M13 family metallopeptidase [Prevotellaceae bacterium]MDY6130989.1 M13 family metallopeptidase [Prevotella sp.]